MGLSPPVKFGCKQLYELATKDTCIHSNRSTGYRIISHLLCSKQQSTVSLFARKTHWVLHDYPTADQVAINILFVSTCDYFSLICSTGLQDAAGSDCRCIT